MMDFGDILEQWDKMQKAGRAARKESGETPAPHKKANAPRPAEAKSAPERSADIADIAGQEAQWLRRHPVVDKDALAEKTAARRLPASRRRLDAMKADAQIDLHGLTREEARQRLDAFVSECVRRRLRKILIIHGKGIHTPGGDSVLGEFVRRYIEQDSRLGASGHPDSRTGGSGATWVILKAM